MRSQRIRKRKKLRKLRRLTRRQLTRLRLARMVELMTKMMDLMYQLESMRLVINQFILLIMKHLRYGVQQMNQSRDKPSIIITHIGDLTVSLNDKTVNIRGRLHTSRAKGKQCFMVIRQQQVTVQCLVFVSEQVSKQMVKFASHIR